MIAASLYFYNNAPDVALAEIAVGSAFIPLIFLITISKQRRFIVKINTEKEFIYMSVLEEFCKKENLKLDIIKASESHDEEAKTIHGVFRRQDVDIIIDYNPKKKRYDLLCKDSNIMIERFATMTQKVHGIRLVKTKDEETLD